MRLVVCQNCGKQVTVTVGYMLGEVICSKCNSYLGEIFEVTDEDDWNVPVEKIFVIPLIEEAEEDEIEKARGTIPRFEEMKDDKEIN